MNLEKTRQKGLQIILPTNVINARLRLFVFISARSDINAAAEQSDHPQEEEELQCSLVNCLRWSAVKIPVSSVLSRLSAFAEGWESGCNTKGSAISGSDSATSPGVSTGGLSSSASQLILL